MNLNPRKYKHLKTFRNKSINFFQKKKINFGNCKFIALKKIYLSLYVVQKIIRVLKFFLKQKSKNYKKFFLNINFNFIFSRKAKGSRMGKGKGKKVTWVSVTKPGDSFIEFRGYTLDKVLFIHRKLSMTTSFILKLKIKHLNFIYI